MNSSREAVICLSNPDAAVLKRLDQAPGADYKPQRFAMHASDVEELVSANVTSDACGRKDFFHTGHEHGKDG